MDNKEFILELLDHNISNYLRVERNFNGELINLIHEKLCINEEDF